MDWYISCSGSFAVPVRDKRPIGVFLIQTNIAVTGEGSNRRKTLREILRSLWQEELNRPHLPRIAKLAWESRRTTPDDWAELRSDTEDADWIEPGASLPQEQLDPNKEVVAPPAAPTEHDALITSDSESSRKPSITLAKPSQPIAAYLERAEPVPKKAQPSQSAHSKRHTDSTESPLKMDFICRDVRSKWVPCIRVNSANQNLTVSQGNEPLHQVVRECYEIRDLFTPVRVTLNDNSEIRRLLDGAQDHMVFRMSQDWGDPGRVCRHITPGYYIVFAPDTWARDIEAAGSPPIEAESTSLSGYQVHFFHIEEGSRRVIRFLSGEGDPIDAYSSSFFCLEGNEQRRVSRRDPPLFLGEFPSMRPVAGRTWDEICRIEILASNQSGLKVCIDPNNRDDDGSLCCVEGIRQSGQYQIKAICAETHLVIDSKTVRFFASFQSIEVENATILPDRDGHDTATLVFHTNQPVKVAAVDNPSQLCVQSEEDRICASIPPFHENDLPRWRVKDHHYETTLDVQIPRVWWALCRTKSELSNPNWTSKPLSLSHSDFNATSQTALLVLPPVGDELDIEGAGITWKGRRGFSSLPRQSIRSLSLRSFYDDIALKDLNSEKSIRLFVRGNRASKSIEIATVQVTLRCRECRRVVTRSDRQVHSLSHLEDLIPKLTYAEVRQRINTSWPEEIIRCANCGHYIEVANGRYSTAEMSAHIEKDCEKAPRGFAPAQLSIRVVTDIDEIRQSVLAELSLFWKCTLCGRIFDESERNLRANHLTEEHLDELYDVE